MTGTIDLDNSPAARPSNPINPRIGPHGKAQKIIIDTDPGQDDAAAIMLALASPDQLDVLGLTVVAGNVPLSMTSRNARIVCELSGRPDLPVYEGALKPLERPQVTAEHVHGKTGLDGAEVDEPVMPVQDQHAVDFIIDTIRREPAGTITLCTLGPQTNIALALQKAPDIAPRIRELVMMGGGFFEGGNITLRRSSMSMSIRRHPGLCLVQASRS